MADMGENARNLTPFLFEGEALVRVVVIDDSPWFVAKDACAALGIVWKGSDSTGPLGNLDDDEKGVSQIPTLGGPQDVVIISESGLYAFIMKSRKPAARRFRRWVTGEVLPAIRRTGRYETSQATIIERNEPSEQVRDAAFNLRTVTETRQSWGAKAAQQMWLKLGLPTVPAMFDPAAQRDLLDHLRDPVGDEVPSRAAP